jgi:hypothetical protein
MFMAKAKHDWAKLDPRIDTLKAQGWTDTQIAKDLNLGRQTLVDHLRSRESVHLGAPETIEVIEVPQETPEHPGALDGSRRLKGHADATRNVGDRRGGHRHGHPDHPGVGWVRLGALGKRHIGERKHGYGTVGGAWRLHDTGKMRYGTIG